MVSRAADLGWVAGLVDGEGTITLGRNGRTYRVVFRVASTDRAALEEARAICGGIGWISPSGRPRKSNHKQGFTWQLYSRQAIRILEMIGPYLRIKRQHAAVALEYQRNLRSDRCANQSLTEEELWGREVLRGIMRELNRKGP